MDAFCLILGHPESKVWKDFRTNEYLERELYGHLKREIAQQQIKLTKVTSNDKPFG